MDSKDRVPSIISASLRIVGDLVSEGDVQVDGIIEGDVNARSLTVSEGAAPNRLSWVARRGSSAISFTRT
jgi:hypothetical protein